MSKKGRMTRKAMRALAAKWLAEYEIRRAQTFAIMENANMPAEVVEHLRKLVSEAFAMGQIQGMEQAITAMEGRKDEPG